MQRNSSERVRHIRERISNHAPWGVIHLDANLQIAGVNAWVLETFGLEEHLILTQHISSLLSIMDTDLTTVIHRTVAGADELLHHSQSNPQGGRYHPLGLPPLNLQ